MTSGVITCRWVMPYQKTARVTLLNLGKQKVDVSLAARVGPWKWDDRSMHFHTTWRQQVNIPTGSPQDWNFLTAKGQGVFVGDTLAVYNPLATWYGEGNEKIYVDGEYFPSHLGTGTEDYYNASWAPVVVYHTPFAGAPRVDTAVVAGAQHLHANAESRRHSFQGQTAIRHGDHPLGGRQGGLRGDDVLVRPAGLGGDRWSVARGGCPAADRSADPDRGADHLA